MDLTLELLAIQNPWWNYANRKAKHPFNFKFEPIIARYEKNRLKRKQEILGQFELKRDKIYCLTGPKGVGKTTILKLVARKLIEEDKINSDQVFYYACDNLESFEQFNEMVKLFLNRREQKKRSYILIDEIAVVKNWQSGLSHLNRAGKLKNTTLIFTSSFLEKSSLNDSLKIEHLRLSGLDLSEFIGLINPALFKKIKPNNYRDWGAKLEYYLDIYLLTGGNIAAINDYRENGAVSQSHYETCLFWLLARVSRLGRDTVLLKQIMEKIIASLGLPVGYKTVSQKTKAKTHLTAAEYLNLLEDLLAIKIVYQADKGRPDSRKAKKIYFQDPFIFWLFYSYTHNALDYWQLARERLHDKQVFSHLLENAVLSHLIKEEKNKITYWRDNMKKREIDFLVKQGRSLTPVLIKYASAGHSRPELGTRAAQDNEEIKDKDWEIFKSAGFRRGIIISKDVLKNSGNVKIMPLSYFLMFYKKFI